MSARPREVVVRNWTEIVDLAIDRYRVARDSGGVLWFRGHSCARWSLLPSLHRHVRDAVDARGRGARANFPTILRDEFKSTYYRFQHEAMSMLEADERTPWGIVFAMQHYGIPTNLLDWTESLVCGLYFALSGRAASDDAVLFVLQPERLNEAATGRRGLVALTGTPGILDTRDWLPVTLGRPIEARTIALGVHIQNRRMVAQRARFTVAGYAMHSIEHLHGDVVERVVIPAEICPDVQAFVDVAGQGTFGYFPDLQGLGESLREVRNYTIERINRWRADDE